MAAGGKRVWGAEQRVSDLFPLKARVRVDYTGRFRRNSKYFRRM